MESKFNHRTNITVANHPGIQRVRQSCKNQKNKIHVVHHDIISWKPSYRCRSNYITARRTRSRTQTSQRARTIDEGILKSNGNNMNERKMICSNVTAAHKKVQRCYRNAAVAHNKTNHFVETLPRPMRKSDDFRQY